jgi:uncharacterized membrane protein YeaQ/YmgE (transglycosylase-associated protein family)
MSIVIGLAVGVIARLQAPSKDPGGFFLTILFGILGAELARLIGRGLGVYQAGEAIGFFASIGGAMLSLALYRSFQRNNLRDE